MRKKILFGSGQAAIDFLAQINYEGINYVVDNNEKKWGGRIQTLEIHPPIKLKEEKSVLIIIASMYYTEISDQLKLNFNLKEGIDFVHHELYFSANASQAKKDIVYPTVINFPVTNKCNFRCAMCNVWKPEYAAHKDLTPVEIGKIFNKPLFKRLSHIGISGGEPFVRKDLELLITEMVENTPSLKSLSIITNCSMNQTHERVLQIKKYLDSKAILFSLQVSIDGVGNIHDLNRGKNGAFNLMYTNFVKLNDLGIVNEISTTITKFNINSLWDNYMFAKKHNVYIRYRLAAPIARLYNNDLTSNFTFNDQEKLLLIKFFENLINNYEQKLEKKMHYYSLINILKNGNRVAGCQYQTSEGVSLDPYGNIHFCFPFSEKIGNINDGNEYDCSFLEDNKDKLESAKMNCKNCIHDYSGPYTEAGSKMIIDILSRNYKVQKELNNYIAEYRLRGEIIEQ
ncbi:radical SAM protein [Paenibacillus sp. strain BS8-2]